MSRRAVGEPVDPMWIRECIAAQVCPWCGREGLRSLANHTVLVHDIRADELRELAGLNRAQAVCSSALSQRHRELAQEQGTTDWLHRPGVRLAGAATREANYTEDQRRRRVEQLAAVRPKAMEGQKRAREGEKRDPELAAARRLARSKARRAFRPGAECPTCGAWFCSVAEPGKDYRQRKYCGPACEREAYRRTRRRSWRLRAMAAWAEQG